jgi:hypothetical protein
MLVPMPRDTLTTVTTATSHTRLAQPSTGMQPCILCVVSHHSSRT